jgi:response regulator RpfG family c-di-GMP phosphodiesterase
MTLSESATAAPAKRPGAAVVVCLDDEAEILSALRREFRQEAFEVLATRSPEEALRWIETLDVDVVLSDQRMPGMLGTDFLMEVRRRSPLTRRVILTGFPWATLSAPGASEGIQDLVCKPWGRDTLRRQIRDWLRERREGNEDEDGRPA